jgi:ribonucleotide reductase beta subunit family protein with ferritin-like domain
LNEDLNNIIAEKCKNTRIMTHTNSMVEYYPFFSEKAEEASRTFWPGKEYTVKDDLNDFLVNMTEAELHGIKTVLKLFTLYEIKIGSDYWANYIIPNFPRPEITRMAAAFCHVENNSHAVFYDLINKVLGLSNDEFYNEYLNDPVLAERAKSIGTFIKNKNPLISVSSFSMLEGSVLYSNFGFLKSFGTNGKNLARNMTSGISASVTDELLHSLCGAALYNTLLQEANLTKEEKEYVESEILKVATVIYDHECKIINMIFSKGPMNHITSRDLKIFVASRINICLQNLNIEPMFSNLKNNRIAEWFYTNVNNMQSIDFFNAAGKEYTVDWAKEKFLWIAE